MYINEKNYADEAEKVIRQLKEKVNPKTNKAVPMVTTSKLRGMLSMASDIYNEVIIQQEDALSEELQGRIEYLRIRMVYDAGREPTVKYFVEAAKLLEIIREINGSRKNYILFNRYMESLVAFHKFYGGKDN